MVGADLASHVVLQALRPAKVSQLNVFVVIQEEVQALKVPMQDRNGSLVKVVHASSSLQSKKTPLLPTQLLLPLENRP